MENHNFLWENPLLMAIFNSYVKLPIDFDFQSYIIYIYIYGQDPLFVDHFAMPTRIMVDILWDPFPARNKRGFRISMLVY